MKQPAAAEAWIAAAWCYTNTCAIMLVLTGVFKLHSVAEHGPAMVQLDAIFQIRNGVLMATLGFLEIAVGVTILCSPRSPWSLATLIWLGSSFVLYHVIRWIVGAPGLCP